MVKANLTLDISCKRRWWFPIALTVGFWLLYFNLIADADSDEHFGGQILAIERVTSWIVKHALIIEAVPSR